MKYSKKSFAFLTALLLVAGANSVQAATWTGTDVSNGGTLTVPTTAQLVGNETITISNPISGNQGLTLRGPGTVVLAAENTMTDAIYISAGTATQPTTVKLTTGFAVSNLERIMFGEHGVLDIAAQNALGYVSQYGEKVTKLINMKGNATLTVSAANVHANLGNVNIERGTNNLIEAKNGLSGTGLNFLLGGKFTVAENAQLLIDAEALTTRQINATLFETDGTTPSSGIFDIATGGNVTIRTSLADKTSQLYIDDTGGRVASLVKKGDGTLIVEGHIRPKQDWFDGSTIRVEAGTLQATNLTNPGTTIVQAGTLKVTDEAIFDGDNATLTLDTGKIEVGRQLTVENGGSMVVNGGEVSVGTQLAVGASLKVLDGTLTVGELNVWSMGVAELNGGTGTLTNLAGNGKTVVDGATISFAENSSIGELVVHSGNVTFAKDLELRYNATYPATKGTMTIDGGEVTVKTLKNTNGTTVSGGKLTITGAVQGNGPMNLDNGELVLAEKNVFGYVGAGLATEITMANGSTLTNKVADGHSNLGNIQVSGTGNQINADGNGSEHGNFFLAGKITVADNSDLTMNMKTALFREAGASLMDGGTVLAGIVDVGAGSTLTANIDTIKLQCTRGAADLRKQGAGLMVVNGALTSEGTVTVEEGTLYLNGTQTHLGATTVKNGAMLGAGVQVGALGTLEFETSPVTIENGARLEVNLTAAGSDIFNFSSLTLKDGAQIELVLPEGETYAESYNNFLRADELLDENSDVVTNLLGYLTGDALNHFSPVLADGGWSLVATGPTPPTPGGAATPEPSTIVLLALGAGLLVLGKRRKNGK